jgi:fructose-bisphosphate aldolase class 1
VATAQAMVAEGKGILAADESNATMGQRLVATGVESTAETRRRFRELLFTTPGAPDHISGVILYDETLRQTASDGTPFPQLLAARGLIPGIKVDTGAKPLAGAEGESTGFSDFCMPDLSGPENRAAMTRFVMCCRSDGCVLGQTRTQQPRGPSRIS